MRERERRAEREREKVVAAWLFSCRCGWPAERGETDKPTLLGLGRTDSLDQARRAAAPFRPSLPPAAAPPSADNSRPSSPLSSAASSDSRSLAERSLLHCCWSAASCWLPAGLVGERGGPSGAGVAPRVWPARRTEVRRWPASSPCCPFPPSSSQPIATLERHPPTHAYTPPLPSLPPPIAPPHARAPDPPVSQPTSTPTSRPAPSRAPAAPPPTATPLLLSPSSMASNHHQHGPLSGQRIRSASPFLPPSPYSLQPEPGGVRREGGRARTRARVPA